LFYPVYLSPIFTGMRKRQKFSIVKKRIIAIVILAVVYFLLQLLEAHPATIERYYSTGIYPIICRILHPIFNLFPFSIGDVVYLVAIGFIIYYLIKLFRLLFKKQFKAAAFLLLGIIITLQIATISFYCLWGLNYFRPSAGERLKLSDSDYTTAQLYNLAQLAIDSANATRARVTVADLHQTNKAITQTAITAVQAMSASSNDFLTYSPNIKLSLFTPLLNYLGTSGYYNPFTTESQINYQMPVFLKPFVACHEMSHQMGYGAEDEANFVGFLVGIKSNDRLLRYSAWHEVVDECMGDLRERDSTLQIKLKKQVLPAVHQDFVAERIFWLSHQGPIDMISSIFYNDFLKANNQPNGLKTYNRMVRLVMSWEKERGVKSEVPSPQKSMSKK
jgi:hypothetical protein